MAPSASPSPGPGGAGTVIGGAAVAGGGAPGDDLAHRQLKTAMAARGSGDIEALRTAIEIVQGTVGAATEKEIAAAQKLLANLEERQRPLTFTDVPREEMESLQACPSREQIKDLLMKCMHLSLADGYESEILAEFHYHNFAFCQRMRFTAEKASTFLSIMKMVHTVAVVEEKCVAVRALELFEALVDRHSRQLPPYSVGVFSRSEAVAFKDYARRTFFRHYKMYLFAYVREQELDFRAAVPSVVPTVPSLVSFSQCHEVNPEEVPELRDLFRNPAEEEMQRQLAAMQAASEANAERKASKEVDPALAADEATLEAALDQSFEKHMGPIQDAAAPFNV